MTTHHIDSAKVFALARKHLGNGSAYDSSARSCMADAMRLSAYADTEHHDRAMICAMRSLAYSIGILHADYAKAFHASGIGGEVRLVS